MDYKYVYFVTADTENIEILTPWCKSLNDVKKEVLHQSPGHIVYHTVYPNGLDLLFDQTERVVVRSNRPLIDNGDGTFTAPES